MGKSLRSKWKRKMRAVKRVRYGVKELAKLKTMVANSEDQGQQQFEDVATVVDSQSMIKKPKRKSRRRNEDEDEIPDTEDVTVDMDVDGTKPKKYRNFKDESGNYPEWLHPRKIRKMKFAQKLRIKNAKRLDRKNLK